MDTVFPSPSSPSRDELDGAARIGPASWVSSLPSTDVRASASLERVLAVGRAFLTIAALAATYLDPNQPTRLLPQIYAILVSYAIYALIVLTLVYRAPWIGPRHGPVLHGLDILWTVVLTFIGGPTSPLYLFFLLVVLSAAYRWGMAGTLATTCLTFALYLGETAIAWAGPLHDAWVASGDLEIDRIVLRSAYMLLMGFLLGYLAEQDKRSRAELAAIASLTREPQIHRGIGGSVMAVSRALLRMFDAESIRFVFQDFETHEASVWRLDRGMITGTRNPPRVPIDSEQQALWFFPDPGQAWRGTRTAEDPDLEVQAVHPNVSPLQRDHVSLPGPVAGSSPFTSLLVANLGLSEEWRGRVYLFDPRTRGDAEQSLRFMNALVEHVTPALTNVFLLGRLRAKVTAAERARVARELHDGAIQSLIGIELKVEALRRRTEPVPAAVAAELADVQQLLRQQVLELRELMQALRPLAIDASEQLPDVLASIVERFRRDTGVPARFMFTGGATRLPPAIALEVVRIAQEALVNVRKHSRARSVLVRLTGGEHGYILAIEDDGVGFDFEGHVSGEELDRRRLGPAIIRERARAAGAHLSIDSTPGTGSRIELIVNASHA